MRTTLTIDDTLAQQLKNIAHQSGRSFKQVVNETLRAGLRAGKTPQPGVEYELQPVSLGEPRAEYNLDKALALADALEDEALTQKMSLRK